MYHIFIITRGNIIPLFEGGVWEPMFRPGGHRGEGEGKKGGFCTQKSRQEGCVGYTAIAGPITYYNYYVLVTLIRTHVAPLLIK